jgi:hypothetical protein
MEILNAKLDPNSVRISKEFIAKKSLNTRQRNSLLSLIAVTSTTG